MTNKKSGRIGDTPLIGAGTYADNKTCAVSATGHGEYIIRGVVAYDIAAMTEYRGFSLQEAVREAIHIKLNQAGGTGGVIALNTRGDIAMANLTITPERLKQVDFTNPTSRNTEGRSICSSA